MSLDLIYAEAIKKNVDISFVDIFLERYERRWRDITKISFFELSKDKIKGFVVATFKCNEDNNKTMLLI